MKICHAAPSVSHLLFADDSLNLIRANEGDAHHLQEIMDLYERCSGQMINKAKSAVLFSKNTKPPQKLEVCTTLQVNRETMSETYLGLPVHVGRSRGNTFAYLKDRIWNRIQGWKENFLSLVGKEILIKAVAQAIPTFAMGCFDITKSLCDEISSMVCRFWWNQQEGKRKIHWLSKDQMMKSKNEGGLSFRDIYAFNWAMLAKQGWRLWQNPDSLYARILKAKYFPNTSVLQAGPKGGMSYTWRSVLRGIELMKKGIIWRVGNGRNLKIWSDPWLPRGDSWRPITPRRGCILTDVDELMNPKTGGWDVELVNEIFWEEDANLILALPIHEERDNLLAWHFDEHGLFSVRSAYKICRAKFLRSSTRGGDQGGSSGNLDPVWDRIWKLRCPNKVKHFLWRFTHNSHPLRSNLARRGMKLDTKCPVCERFIEDGAHLFSKCKLPGRYGVVSGLIGYRKNWRELQTPRKPLRSS